MKIIARMRARRPLRVEELLRLSMSIILVGSVSLCGYFAAVEPEHRPDFFFLTGLLVQTFRMSDDSDKSEKTDSLLRELEPSDKEQPETTLEKLEPSDKKQPKSLDNRKL